MTEKDTGGTAPPTEIKRTLAPDETVSQHMAKLIIEPQARHAFLGYALAGTLFKEQRPDALDMVDHLTAASETAEAGSTGYVTRVLLAQAATLDALFTDLTHRAIENAGRYPDAFHRYATLALKTQSNCRVTLEALAKLHTPREQIVRHVHVHEGGQAVVADEFHHHAEGGENVKSIEQAHAVMGGAALPCPDPLGHSVPISCREREKALPDARRRKGERSAEG